MVRFPPDARMPMKTFFPFRILAVTLASALCASQLNAQLVRQPNTTLVMPATPPTQGYALENTFGDPAFSFPVKIVTPPGETNRIFVVERTGLIKVITDLTTPPATPPTFIDLTDRVVSSTSQGEEQGLLGLAFHPQYATNGFFYVYYTVNVSGAAHERLSRFTVTAGNPNSGNRTTELVLFSQPDPATNHNGGDIMFGPDGYLYVSLGDGGGANDSTNHSQKIDNGFFSGVVRIDVDRKLSNLEPNNYSAVPINGTTGKANYKVPADNPFVGATSFNGLAVTPANVRTEYWAVGLRNPWRMNFDPASGRLYAGDVGQNAHEEIDLIKRGENYGWKWREGFSSSGVSGTPPPGFSPVDPLIDYPRTDGFAVTGGLVYRGSRFSQLYGQYVFADYGGTVWRLPLDQTTGRNVGNKLTMLVASLPVSFGTDPRNGDILVGQLGSSTGAGRVKRLVASGTASGTLPATLSATGAFSDLTTLTPNPGVVPYDPNVPFWSDYAIKRRWFSVPNAADKLAFNESGTWNSPAGTVWVKHFDIDTTRGNSATRRRLETRFIVRNAGGIYGVTYRWNVAQTDADLVPDEGATETFNVVENGVTRSQTWIYPSRASCLNCHSAAAGYSLSFNTAQLNRSNVYAGQTQNQIEALSAAGYFATPVPSANTFAKFADADDASQSVEWRVRSYLAVNCVGCHQPGGLGVGNWDARQTTKTANAGLVNGVLNNDLGDPANRVLLPGDLARSVLYQRIASAAGAANHMPPIATNETNPGAAALLAQWLQGDLVSSYQTFTQWQLARFGSTTAPGAQAAADPDGDGNGNQLEYLVGTDPLSAAQAWRYSVALNEPAGTITFQFPRLANRRFQIQISDDAQTWRLWDVPQNAATFSATSFMDTITGPDPGTPKQFFRFEVDLP